MKREKAGWMVVVLVGLLAAGAAQAQTITKANNTTALNAGGSWVGGVAPGSGDTALWDSTVAVANSSALGGSVTWGRIQLTNPGGAITIGNTASAVLTLNGMSGTGIDMTSASQNLTIANPITLGGPQTWTVASGRTLTTGNGANLIDNNGHDLTVDNTGAVSFGVTANNAVTLMGSGNLVKNGTGRLNVGGTNTSFTGRVTINGGVLHANNQANVLGNGNLSLNGGVISFYWSVVYTRSLGTGNNQVQLLGGASGVAGAGSTGPTINLGSTVVWGAAGEGSATGYFNPSTFVVADSGTGNAARMTFSSGINLNGATRTIAVPYGTSAGGNISTISGAIGNTTGTAGITKTGGGRLILSGSRTYNGDTTVSNGFLQVNSGNANDNEANVTIDSGASLILNFTGTDTVFRLMINGEYQAIGEYGHTNSSATNGGLGVGALDAYFGAGNGKLNVTMGPPPPAGTVVIVK